MKKMKIIDFPDCWEEVRPEEWAYLMKLRHQMATRKGISLLDVKRAWCDFVLMRRGIKAHGTRGMLLVDQLADTLEWMWLVDDEEGCISLRFNTTKNLLPYYKGLIGPASHGADLTFGEFRTATAAMNLYTQGHQPNDLLAMVAVLYRGKDKRTGRRQAFDTDELPRLMEDVLDIMPGWLQWGVYAWFAYFCEYLLSGLFVIDGEEITFSPVFTRRDPSESRSSAQDLGLNSILYTVAESGVFGTANETDRTPLLRVLLKLLDDKQRADEMLQKIKKG